MVLKKKILVAALVAMALGCSLVQSLGAVDPVLAPPIVFEGYVYIGADHAFKGGELELYVRRGSEFVPGLVVKLEDRVAAYARNYYSCRYEGLHPAPGSIVTVSIERGPVVPGARGARLLVTGRMPSWLAITSPRDGDRIASAGAPSLSVAWNGGDAPYSLVIRDLSTRRVVFRADAIAGTSQSVPMGTFTPGTKYRLDVWTAERMMTFGSPVAPGSTFKLGQYHSLEFAIE